MTSRVTNAAGPRSAVGGAGSYQIHPATAAGIIAVTLILIIAASMMHFGHAASRTGKETVQLPVTPAIRAQDAQFLAALQSTPANQRNAFVNRQDPTTLQMFLGSATPQQKAEFANSATGR